LNRWLVPGVTAAGFGLLFFLGGNQRLFLALNALGPMTSDLLWANVTILGDAAVVLALGLALWRRRPDLLWGFLITAILATLWARGFKPLLDVPRPPAVLGDAVHVIGRTYRADSFPSGHATAAFALAGVLVMGVRHTALTVFVLAVATLAALSRAVVGVHWPLDILGGAFGGWLAAVLGLVIGARTRGFGARPAVQWAGAAVLGGCAVALAAGYPHEYPDAVLFQRAIGICCLVVAATTLVRERQRRHPDL
jgi:membrane-associated phospholipid phosphatase